MSYVQWTLPVLASRQWNRPLKSATKSRSSLMATVPIVRCNCSSKSILPLPLASLVGVVPDDAGVRDWRSATSPSASTTACIRLSGIGFFGSVAVDGQLRADVAALGRIDAPQDADAFAVLGILAGAEVDLVVVDDRRADDVVPRAAAAEFQNRVLGVGVELPQQLRLAVLALVGLEAVEPAVAAAEDHLRHAADARRPWGSTIGRGGCSCRASCRSRAPCPCSCPWR